jgi:hypothetical protein
MCKAEGNLTSGTANKKDCGKCSCPMSSAKHDLDENGRCKNCRQHP